MISNRLAGKLRALLVKALPESARPLLVNGYVGASQRYADIWHSGGPGGEVARAYDDDMADLIAGAVNALPGLLNDRAQLISALEFAKTTIENMLGDYDLYQNTPEFRAYNRICSLLRNRQGPKGSKETA